MREAFEKWWEQWCGEKPWTGWSNLRTEEGYKDQDIDMQYDAFCAGVKWEASRNDNH